MFFCIPFFSLFLLNVGTNNADMCNSTDNSIISFLQKVGSSLLNENAEEENLLGTIADNSTEFLTNPYEDYAVTHLDIPSEENTTLRHNKTGLENAICTFTYTTVHNETVRYTHNFTCRENNDCAHPEMVCDVRKKCCECTTFHTWNKHECNCVPNIEALKKSIIYSAEEVQRDVVTKDDIYAARQWKAYHIEDDGGFLGYLKVTWPIMLCVILLVMVYIAIYVM